VTFDGADVLTPTSGYRVDELLDRASFARRGSERMLSMNATCFSIASVSGIISGKGRNTIDWTGWRRDDIDETKSIISFNASSQIVEVKALSWSWEVASSSMSPKRV